MNIFSLSTALEDIHQSNIKYLYITWIYTHALWIEHALNVPWKVTMILAVTRLDRSKVSR